MGGWGVGSEAVFRVGQLLTRSPRRGASPKHRTGGARDQQDPMHSLLDVLTISVSEPPNDALGFHVVRHALANRTALHGRVFAEKRASE
jgi:hypothetical protein